MIVLSGGENISPARIEAMLVDQPEIMQAVVFGEGRVGLSALVVAADGRSEADTAAAVTRVNRLLSATERIRRHAVVAPFTLDNGQMTATQKVKRHLVIERHRDVVKAMKA
jgi:long-chain acyl-CoA synthetase